MIHPLALLQIKQETGPIIAAVLRKIRFIALQAITAADIYLQWFTVRNFK
jgi:hypothetical protein